MQAKQKAEQDARDKEWDDARAKEQAERDARKAEDRAKEKEREDARDAKWAAEDKATEDRWAAESAERNKGRQGATHTPVEGRQGATYKPTKGIGSSKNASTPPEEIAEIEKDGKLYFDDYKDGHQVEFTLMYNGKPACNWDIEIILGKAVVAIGKTDSQGKFSSTYYGLLGTAFKVEGKRPDISWSVEGFWYINKREYQAGEMVMEIEKFEKYLSESMGVNSSYAAYGLTSGCR